MPVSAHDHVPPPRRPVFVIEDSDEDFDLLQRVLAKAAVPASVDRACSGNQAIATLAAAAPGRVPALILTDLAMPDGDGFEFLAWAGRQQPLRETLLVVLSSTRRGADIDRAYGLGAHFFLSKFPAPAMLARLCAAAERRDVALGARLDPFRGEARLAP